MRYNTIQALENSEAAECLSVHTSAGVPPSMDRFLAALRPHLASMALELLQRAAHHRQARLPCEEGVCV